MNMNMNINNANITQAVKEYMSRQGITKTIESVEFTVGRRKKNDTSPAQVSAVVYFASDAPAPKAIDEDSPVVSVEGGSEDAPVITPETSNEESKQVASPESIFTS